MKLAPRTLNKNVFIVGNDAQVARIFFAEDFEIVDGPKKANLIVFTGGGDIEPKIYNQQRILQCGTSNKDRDDAEIACYKSLSVEQTKIGICRGGQLLNVLNGGSMYQHVDKHNGANHRVLVKGAKDYVWLNSYHHQMMIPNFEAVDLDVIGIAAETTERHLDKGVWRGRAHWETDPDFEILWYEATRSFCYQPHPEWGNDTGSNPTRDTFFKTMTDLAII